MPSPPPSFDDWFRRLRPKMLRLAYSRLGDHGEAEDVVQETALALWRRLPEGGIEDLDAYAARAVWQNALRRRERRLEWDELDEAELDPTEPEIEAWLDTLEMEDAIAALPPAQQAVLRLRYYAGHSFKETAMALAISLNTAASRCRYALENLRQKFHPQVEEEDRGKAKGKRTGRTDPTGRQLRRRQRGGRGRDA